MQISELYRRGVVVPLTKVDEESFLKNDIEKNTAVQFYEFPNDELFYSLWEKGLFESINMDLNLMLDDYEEEHVEIHKVPMLIEIVKNFAKSKSLEINCSERKVISAIIRLCDIAVENERQVFFIF